MVKKPIGLSESDHDKRVLEAREHILSAASLLRGLNTEMDRVAWMLEDALTFIEDAEEADQTFIEEVFSSSEAEFIPAHPINKRAKGGSRIH